MTANLTYEEWFVYSLSMKQVAFSTESSLVSISTIVGGGLPSTYRWFDLRTREQVTPPYLNPEPLTQQDIDYTVLVEVETGSIQYTFPPTIVPTFQPALSPGLSPQPTLNPTSNPTPIPTPTSKSPILGTEGNDNLLGTADNDELIGLGGDDRLTGYGGNDTLKGGDSNDRLAGGNGKDILWGGKGNNILQGGANRDTFVMESGSGQSAIIDFQDRQDKLGLSNGIRFKDLKITQRGNKLVINLGRDQLAVLDRVKIRQITAGDFVQSGF